MIGFLIFLMFVAWIPRPQDVTYFDDNGYAEHVYIDYTSDPNRCQVYVDFMDELYPDLTDKDFPPLHFDIESGHRYPEDIRTPSIECYSTPSTAWQPMVIVFSDRKTLLYQTWLPLTIR